MAVFGVFRGSGFLGFRASGLGFGVQGLGFLLARFGRRLEG